VHLLFLFKIADFQPIIARGASAVTPSEKSSINTNRKSITGFPMSLRWSLYVAPRPPKGAQNTKRPFSVNRTSLEESLLQSFFAWKLSATKLWGNHWPTIRANTIGGRRPLLPEMLGKTDRVGAKSPIFDLFSLVAPPPH